MRHGMRKAGPENSVRELHAKALRIRQTFCNMFEAPPPNRIVLVPSILGALQILFANMQVRRVLLTDGEYYGAPHLPAQRVMASSVNNLLKGVKEFRPDAVIVSVVTWKGEVLPCAELFSQIRRMRKHGMTPLLVADYCHAGAVGFPSVKKLAADVVCGGAGKWVTPPLWDSRLGFLWFGSELLFSRAKGAFAPFFLATNHQSLSLVSRWIDPAEVRALEAWLAPRSLNRSALIAQYRADKEFASGLAALFGIDCPQSNILWLNHGLSRDKRLRALERLGLTWRMPDGKIRILCRASAGSQRVL